MSTTLFLFGLGFSFFLFSLVNVFHRRPNGLKGQIGLGLITARGRSVPVCLMKHMATCDFPRDGGNPEPLAPLDPTMSFMVLSPFSRDDGCPEC